LQARLDATTLRRHSIGLIVASSAFSWYSQLPSSRCFYKVTFSISFYVVFLRALAELIERGTERALIRLGKQFLSWSPIFEIFSTQIYTHSILSNLTFGGARYIATGRGFATARIKFNILFSRFAGPSIYLGMRTLIMLLYVTMTLHTPYLIYFWISVMALCIAPFVFNPHQFAFADFIIDYRQVSICIPDCCKSLIRTIQRISEMDVTRKLSLS
jgi:1,3-beta-glucan synthase